MADKNNNQNQDEFVIEPIRKPAKAPEPPQEPPEEEPKPEGIPTREETPPKEEPPPQEPEKEKDRLEKIPLKKKEKKIKPARPRGLKDAVIALEIGSDSIKLSESRYVGGAYLFRLASKKISSNDENGILKSLTDLFASGNFSKKKVILNIPSHLVIARFLRLPSTVDEEIKEMLGIEAAKQIPYATEDIIYGHRIIEKFRDGYSSIFLAIAEASIVDQMINILRKANVAVENIVFGSESLYNWNIFINADLKESLGSNIAIVNIDAEYADIGVISKGDPEFARAFKCGPDTASTVEEIKRSITTYQKEQKQNVHKVFIVGADDRSREIETVLKKEASDIPIEIISQSKGVKIDGKLAPDMGALSFIEIIGLSLKPDEMKISLLPRKIVEDKEFRALKKALLAAFILALLVIGFLSASAIKILSDNANYLSSLNREIVKMKPKAETAEKIKNDIGVMKEYVFKRPLAIDILKEIYGTTPEGINFTYIDHETGRPLILRGNAPSLNDILKFIAVLEKSQYFVNVKLKYTTTRQAKDRVLTDFEIVSSVEEAS